MNYVSPDAFASRRHAAALSSVTVPCSLHHASVPNSASIGAVKSDARLSNQWFLTLVSLDKLIEGEFVILVSVSHSETLCVHISVTHVGVFSIHNCHEFFEIDKVVTIFVSSLEFLNLLAVLCESLNLWSDRESSLHLAASLMAKVQSISATLFLICSLAYLNAHCIIDSALHSAVFVCTSSGEWSDQPNDDGAD